VGFFGRQLMDIKQLRALVTVAETGNVTRASALLNTVQPAISRQLRLLEEDVGVTLFERSRMGMELTDAGRTLVECARRVLYEVERARSEVSPSRGSVGGIVTVGMLPSLGNLLPSALLTAVAATHPGIKIHISTGHGGHLPRWLESGELDIALVYDPKRSPSLHVRKLLSEGLWVVGPPGTGIHPDRPVALAELAGKPLVLPNSTHGLRGLVEHAAVLMGIQLNIVAETNALLVQKSLVRGGHGWTVLPRISVVDEIARGLLVAAPLVSPALVRTIALALPANRHATKPVRCVAAALVECMRRAVDCGDWLAAEWLETEPPPVESLAASPTAADAG